MKKINKPSTSILFEQDIKKLHWYIRIRFIAPNILFLATILVDFPDYLYRNEFLVASIFILIFNVYNFIIWSIVKKYERIGEKRVNLQNFVFFQAFIDLFIIAFFIYFDGGIESPIFLAHLIPMLIVSFVAGRAQTIFLAGAAATSYLIFLGLEYAHFIPHVYSRGENIDLHLNQHVVYTDGIFVAVFFILIAVFVTFLNTDIKKMAAELRKTFDSLAKLQDTYRDITDNAFDLIQSADSSGNILYTNRRWKDFLGYTDEEVKDMYISDILKDTDLRIYNELLERLKEDRKDQQYTLTYIKKNKEKLLLEGSLSAKFNKKGDIVSTREILRDVSEREENKEKERQHAQDIEALNETLVGREIRMIEMRKEIEDLKNKLGKNNT